MGEAEKQAVAAYRALFVRTARRLRSTGCEADAAIFDGMAVWAAPMLASETEKLVKRSPRKKGA